MKERSPGPLGILLAVPAAVSLAAWAFEEISVLASLPAPYAAWASLAGLALDSCVLGVGLALAALRVSGSPDLPGASWIEILSSLPVIVLCSAPVAYAFLEGRPETVPPILLAARSLRLLRLRRVSPSIPPGIPAVLVLGEIFRVFARVFLADLPRYAASARLLLVPEALLITAAAVLAVRGFGIRRSARSSAPKAGDPLVGEDELAGLLGKRSTW